MTSDASSGNALNSGPFWVHCAGGMHRGRMDPRPLVGEFGSVLTLAAVPGACEDAIHHRHLPMEEHFHDPVLTGAAIEWVLKQLNVGSVLVRSEGGLQRPSLVIAGVCVRLGATYSEAMYCVRRSDPSALTDSRHMLFISRLVDAQ